MTNTIKYLVFLALINIVDASSKKTKDNDNQKRGCLIKFSKHKRKKAKGVVTIQSFDVRRRQQTILEVNYALGELNGQQEKTRHQNKIIENMLQHTNHSNFAEGEELKHLDKELDEIQKELERQEEELRKQQKELEKQEKEFEDLLKENEQQEREFVKQQKELEDLLKEDEQQQKEIKESIEDALKKEKQFSSQLDSMLKDLDNEYENTQVLLKGVDERVNMEELKYTNVPFQKNDTRNASHQSCALPVDNVNQNKPDYTNSSWLETILLGIFGISISIK